MRSLIGLSLVVATAACAPAPNALFDEAVRLHLAPKRPEDLIRAAKLYDEAARQGHTGAASNLATMYYDGKGVQQSFEKAKELYSRLAAQGDGGAAAVLASMYRDGKGVEQSQAESLRLLKFAARKGYPSAMTSLGFEYRSGIGVQKDELEAYAWWTLAVEFGDSFAADELRGLARELGGDARARAIKRSDELRQEVQDSRTLRLR